jgi:hypothetical protein
LQEENKTLSMHIVELQNDKGDLTDKCRELETQIEKMKSALERWYKQHSDKTYTETFYVNLITDTEILLWRNCEK